MRDHDDFIRHTSAQGAAFQCRYDESWTVIHGDESLFRFLEYTRAEFSALFENKMSGVIHPADLSVMADVIQAQLEHGNLIFNENRLICKSGTVKWVWICAERMWNEAGEPYFNCMFYDITEQRQKNLSVQEQVWRDALTGLYNRSATEEKVDLMLAKKPCHAAMLVVDVDNFKGVNDTFGHIYGDAVLGYMAGHLKRLEGPHDVAGRVGGDEFVVFLGEIESRAEVEACARQIGKVFRRSFAEQRGRHEVSASMGISFYPEDGGSYLELFGKADLATYVSKTTGKNRFTFYQASQMKTGGLMPRRLAEPDQVVPAQMNFRDNIIEYVFRIFYENRDMSHAMDILLDLVGNAFGQSRVCIFELDEKKLLVNTFEWCDRGVSSMRERYGQISVDNHFWREEVFDKEELYNCEDVSLLPANMVNKAWLMARGTRSCLFCCIREGGAQSAIIGFEDCAQPRKATAEERGTLSLIAQTISMFLLRARKQTLLERQQRFSERLLAHNSASLYAVNPVTHRIIYANENLSNHLCGAHVGELCYIALRGMDGPCQDCPMQNLQGDDDTVTQDMYHPQIGMWAKTTATNMEWENGERVCLLSKTDITRYRADAARLAFISESIPGGLLGGYLEDGMPLYFINRHMLDFLGYESQEAFERATDGLILNCVTPADRMETKALAAHAISAGAENLRLTFRMQRRDGALRWVSCRGRRTRAENGRAALLFLCMDITAQKELENQLTLYRSASRGGAFLMRLDDDFTLLYGNDIYYQVHGYTPESMRDRIGNHWRETLSQVDVIRVRTLLENALAEGLGSTEWEMAIITGEGKRRWLRINVSFEQAEQETMMRGFVVDLTEQHKLQEVVERNQQRYRIALRQTGINVWEFDIATRRLHHTDRAERGFELPEYVENAPEVLIESGFIHPDSAADYTELFRKLFAGESCVDVDLKVRGRDGTSWRWERIACTNIFDPLGSPVRTIAVGEDVTLQKEAEIRYQQEFKTRSILAEGLVAGSRANLTQDKIEYLQRTGSPEVDLSAGMTYGELVEMGAQSMVSPEDRVRYEAELSRAGLMEAFAQGRDSVTVEYRRGSPDGRLLWVSATARLARIAGSGDLYAYGSIRDISEQKAMELALRRRAEVDALTGAYHSETAMGMMQDAEARSLRGKKSTALLLVNIDNFNRVVHQCGYQAADYILRELGALLQMKFGGEKIIGRLYGDELSVWLGNSPDPERVRRAAEEIRQTMCMPYMFPQVTLPVTVSIGISFSGAAELDGLIRRARAALAAAKDGGKNQCQVYSEQVGDKKWVEERPIPFESQETEKILLRCAFSLNSSLDFNEAISRVLRDLTEFYGADRAYLMELTRDEKEVQSVVEWRDENLACRRGVSEEVLQAPNAAWLRSLQDQRYSIIEDIAELREEYPDEYQRLREQGVRTSYTISLELDARAVAYLGLNNPVRHRGSLALLDALRHFLVNELIKRRMQVQQEYLSYHDALTGLLNRNCYVRYLEELEPESLISLGVASVDINGLKRLNNEYGHAYGDQIVKSTGHALQEALGAQCGGRVFRFAGDEFLAICENLSLEAFNQRVGQFSRQMAVDYPDSIALGHVWADNDINPTRLISHADEGMVVAKQAYYRASGGRGRRYDPGMLKTLLDDIKAGCYKMYLQPKAEISSEKIAGAEALVRFIHPEGGVIPPDRFIPQLERGGAVRYVDLFIFGQVCQTLSRWRATGRQLLPISLNFSRSTLLEERLLEQMDEIQGEYGVPRALIEIEITESVGAVERETIIRIGAEIVRRGYRLSLDDFGAKYSNLSILSAIKLDVLKLDKSLVNDLSSNPSTRVVVKNFLAACRELEIASVAEGVETKEQLNILRDLGCDYAQGYYFNKPIPLPDFEKKYL